MSSTSERPTNERTRTYERASSVVFLKTDAPFGGLSNMAGGFPLHVQGTRIYTSEALYQACRFPHLPEVQRLIIGQASPMTAKMKSKPHRKDSRPDWDRVRVKVMRWCLRVKLAQNWAKFSELLLRTDDRPIVEESRRDDFWGAKPVDDRTLVGMNVLGRLLMELREAVKSHGRDAFLTVEPPDIPEFLLLGRPIMGIGESDLTTRDPKAAPGAVPGGRRPMQDGIEQASLFDAPSAREAPSPGYVTQKAPGGALLGDLKPYPAMKDSGVPWLGQVPTHWEVPKLRGILRRVTERNRSDLPLLSVVRERGVIHRDTTDQDVNHNFIPDDLSNYKVVRPGQFAMNKMKAWQGSYGVSQYEGIVSPAYFVFDLAEVEGRFFHTAIRSRAYVASFAQASDGVRIGQWDLAEPRMREIAFAIPPLSEQAAIVRFIEHADRRIRRYIRAKQKLVKLLEEQKQAIIHHAVTRGLDPNVRLKPSGVEWLGDVPEHWEILPLRRRWSVTDCKHLTVPFVDNVDGIPLASVREVQSFELSLANAKRTTVDSFKNLIEGGRQPRKGDLIYCRNVSVGAAAIVNTDDPLAMGQDVCLIRSSAESQRYLNYFLRSPAMQHQLALLLVGSTFNRINVADIKALVIVAPPRREQDSIVDFLDAELAEASRAQTLATNEISLLREYRVRLIADVVTGKLDVREAAARLPEEAEELEPLDEAPPEADGDGASEYSADEVSEETEA